MKVIFSQYFHLVFSYKATLEFKNVIKSFFFGNYFYGCCATALVIEATLQQRYPLSPFYFYIAIFCGTVWYYTQAYINDKDVLGQNQRTNWYLKNNQFVWFSQYFMLAILVLISIYVLYSYMENLPGLSQLQWFLILVFPISGLFYYGVGQKIIGPMSLREIGWMKPFVIGFTWAGIVNVYPLVFYDMIHHRPTEISFINILLFIKNLMFISVLCIMFDIKDYATDSNLKIKTFVVKNGLRATIFYILLPLSFVGLGCFLAYGFTHQFSEMKIILNTIPFICMIALAYGMHKRRGIMYYLVMIDGMMLLKALCGSVAMIWF